MTTFVESTLFSRPCTTLPEPKGLRSFKVAWTTSTRPSCQLTRLAHKCAVRFEPTSSCAQGTRSTAELSVRTTTLSEPPFVPILCIPAAFFFLDTHPFTDSTALRDVIVMIFLTQIEMFHGQTLFQGFSQQDFPCIWTSTYALNKPLPWV
jgi:hypothetical protein